MTHRQKPEKELLDQLQRDKMQAGDRMYFLGNKSMVQSFNQDLNHTNPDFTGTQDFNNTLSTRNTLTNTLTKQKGSKQREGTRQPTTYEEEPPEFEDLVDYGRDFYLMLRKLHIERTKSEKPSWKDIFSTWKILDRSQQISQSHTFKSRNNFRWENPYEIQPGKDRKWTKASQIRLLKKPLHQKDYLIPTEYDTKKSLVENKQVECVRHTIQKHHLEYENDVELQRKLEEGLLAKARAKEIQRQKKIADRKRERLKAKIRKQRKAASRDPLRASSAGAYIPEEQKKYFGMVNNLIKLHKEKMPDADDFIYPETLFKFWKTLGNEVKREKGLNLDEKEVWKTLHNYYNSRVDQVYQWFKKRKGVDTTSHIALYNFYKNEFPKRERIKMNMKFYSIRNEKGIFKLWCKKLEKRKADEARAMMNKMRAEKGLPPIQDPGEPSAVDEAPQKPTEEQKKRLKERAAKERERAKSEARQLRRRQRSKARLMSRPKDRLKKGKTLLKLKTMFPEDKILSKLIVEEFTQEKIAKRPLEYENIDSDEDDRRKMKHQFEGKTKEFKDTELGFEREERLRNVELGARFSDMLKKYKISKTEKIKKFVDFKKKYKEQQERVDEFILAAVRDYRKLIINKINNEKIPTETKFLSEKYHELKKKEPEATQRIFPHYTYGEAKKLKTKSFPLTFKHQFFSVYRTLERDKRMRVATDNKLGFWAPAGSKSKQCHNRKVIVNSKDTKFASVWEERHKKGVWEEDAFQNERKKILMKLDDAQNCTFYPVVRHKLPEKMKISETETAYNMPENPKIAIEKMRSGDQMYKLKKQGIFRRALYEYCVGEGGPVKAYEILCGTFNIQEIRETLGDPNKDKPPPEGTKLYEILNPKTKKTLDGKNNRRLAVAEDFKDKVYATFLYDVLDLVLMIEAHQKEVGKIKKLTEKQLKKLQRSKDKTASTKDTRPIKVFMCPLQEKCPDFEADRWPVSNNKGSKPLGRDCPLAHHHTELYFPAEKNNREKYLKQLDQKMADNLKAGVMTSNNKDFKYSGKIQTNMHRVMKDRDHPGLTRLPMKMNTKMTPAQEAEAKEAAEKAGGVKLSHAEKLKKSKKVNEKIEQMKKDDDNLKQKLGFLRRAETLYEKERYKEAFTAIVKAIRIVFKEIEHDEELEEEKKVKLRRKLDLDFALNLNKDQILKLQKNATHKIRQRDDPDDFESEEDFEELANERLQKLILFAEKTGVIGPEKWDVRKNLKDQIEDMYNKIVKKLKFDELGITHMKATKAKLKQQLEDMELDSMGNFKVKTKQTESTELGNKWAGKRPREIDLISPQKKIKRLNQAIKLCTEKLIESKPFTPWRFTGPKDTVENAYQVNHVPGRIKVKRKVDSEDEDSDDSEVIRKKKMLKNRPDLFEQGFSVVKQYPWKFKVPEIEYHDIDEHDLDQDEVEGRGRGRGRRDNRDDFIQMEQDDDDSGMNDNFLGGF